MKVRKCVGGERGAGGSCDDPVHVMSVLPRCLEVKTVSQGESPAAGHEPRV